MNDKILTAAECEFLIHYLAPMVRGHEYVTELAQNLPKSAKQKEELVEMLEVQTRALKSLKIRIKKQQAQINLVPFYDMEVVN
ncbi:hypothetical protein [Paucilactobacillus nenjiangensis]|uniref:hypothetical protein n=1 Tax=Paucilactobacillus nenjiangensis TaxID=1296540 RepID=UPI003BB1BE18